MGYSPSNATMVVVGDVSADEVFRLATTYMEPIPAHAPPPKVTTREPAQIGERRLTVKKFAQLPILMVAYHVPEAAHPDYYALRVLQAILFAGQSSRMYQRLVDKDQLALSVRGSMQFALDPTLFIVSSQPKSGVAPQIVENAIYEEFEKAKSGGVTEQELEKAKNILLAQFYRQMKTDNGRANAIGTYEVFFGDYRKLYAAASEYQRITVGDVRRVAAAYFEEKNRTVATLMPESQAPSAPLDTVPA
jgi:zinc protease